MTTAAVRPVAIKIDTDIKERVKRLAEARHRSPHWLMRAGSTYREECFAAHCGVALPLTGCP